MFYNSASFSRYNLAIAQHPQNTLHDELRVIRFKHTESLSELYELELDFISENHHITSDELLFCSARLSLRGGQDTQYINGIIASACQLDIGQRFARYRITIVPRVWLLNYRKGCRIFQNQSVPDIISTLFQEAGLSRTEHYHWATDRNYPKRVYCTQYNETQWDFIQRLLSEEGIHYHFQHTPQQHRMILGDRKTAFDKITDHDIISFNTRSGLSEQEEHINAFGFSHYIGSNTSSLRDYHFKTPRRSLFVTRQSTTQQTLEDYDYPGLYSTESEGQFYAQLRQEQHQVQQKTGRGKGNTQRMRAGQLFSLSGHRIKNHNVEQLIQSITHYGEQPQSLDEDIPASISDNQYRNEFTTIPADVVFRPQRQSRPYLIHGQQYAFVTGPKGEDIYLNEYGQIKVQFLWDRDGQQDEKTTCWMRASNEAAVIPPFIKQSINRVLV